MSNDKPYEFVTPPNMLRVKAGGALPKLDEAAIARAEAAVKAMSAEFGAWLENDLAALQAAFAAARAEGLAGAAGGTLLLRAHDLKGLGTTYEFPLVSRIAASLCRLLEDGARRAVAPMSLAAAHVGAIRAAVRGGTRSDQDPIGAALAAELETRVAALHGPGEPSI